uniref:Uncharacterized protein n=1 Tax=Heterorhabditis bacteriophora TaxID=37862 RepID=A0A1I7WRM5_HETBA
MFFTNVESMTVSAFLMNMASFQFRINLSLIMFY